MLINKPKISLLAFSLSNVRVRCSIQPFGTVQFCSVPLDSTFLVLTHKNLVSILYKHFKAPPVVIVTSFCSEHHRKNGGGLFYVLKRVDFEDEEQLDQTTKMVEIGNSIGGHTLTVCLKISDDLVSYFHITE